MSVSRISMNRTHISIGIGVVIAFIVLLNFFGTIRQATATEPAQTVEDYLDKFSVDSEEGLIFYTVVRDGIGKSNAVWEVRNPSVRTTPLSVTEADKLNGITRKVRIELSVSAYRAFLSKSHVSIDDRLWLWRDGGVFLKGEGRLSSKGWQFFLNQTELGQHIGALPLVSVELRENKKSSLEGVWVGTVEQTDTSPYTLEMTVEQVAIGQLAGRTEYPSVECGGQLILVHVYEERLEYWEQLTNGKERCAENGLIVVEPARGESMHWTWFYPDGRKGAYARLDRKE